jgi:hypothetical protein
MLKIARILVLCNQEIFSSIRGRKIIDCLQRFMDMDGTKPYVENGEES